jgi:hypothetical protein
VALAKCKECGKEVSTAASKCPHCGVPAPTRGTSKTAAMIATAIIAVLIIAVMALPRSGGGGSSSSPSGGNQEVIAGLLSKQPQCRENLQKLEQLGVRVTDQSDVTRAEYDETVWAAFEHTTKVQQALLIFCAKMPPSGHYMVVIRGLHDGKTKASVFDGNYSDE